MRRRRNRELEAAPTQSAGGLVLVSDDFGTLVVGDRHQIAAVVDHLKSLGGGDRSLAVAGADALAGVASAYAVAVTSCEYVRHTSGAVRKLRDLGAIPSEGGAFRSFVRDAENHFAGNLDWTLVDVGPERALALQTAAVTFALRTAIKQVQDAVEEVADKVDRIAVMLRAERLGDALGDRRTLERLVDDVDQRGVLTATDWSSVAGLGPIITRDIEKLRAHSRAQLADAKGGWRPRARAEDAQELLEDDLLAETLALLVIAEHNFALWQQLRIANVRAHEPEYLAGVVDDATTALRTDINEDQALVDGLQSVVAALAAPGALDGFAPLQTRRLEDASARLDLLARWFADQRTLDIAALEAITRPGFKDSVRHVSSRVRQEARALRRKAHRRRDADAPELTTSTSEDGPET